jgi:hypothetical protein
MEGGVDQLLNGGSGADVSLKEKENCQDDFEVCQRMRKQLQY